jgi:hypothetical protein
VGIDATDGEDEGESMRIAARSSGSLSTISGQAAELQKEPSRVAANEQ